MLAHRLNMGASGGFKVQSVDFDGTNDEMTRGALTGAADSNTGIISAWLRLDGSNSTVMTILGAGPNASQTAWGFYRLADNRFYLGIDLTGTLSFLHIYSTSTYTAGSVWRHILASWDVTSPTTPTTHQYINDASNNNTDLGDYGGPSVDYTWTNWIVGSSLSIPDNRFDGCMAELYYAPGQFLDFSNSANRRKFISSAGKPVDLGTDGSLPTGTAPKIYLSSRPGDAASAFGTNKGGGGDFTITGSLDIGSTSPSD